MSTKVTCCLSGKKVKSKKNTTKKATRNKELLEIQEDAKLQMFSKIIYTHIRIISVDLVTFTSSSAVVVSFGFISISCHIHTQCTYILEHNWTDRQTSQGL